MGKSMAVVTNCNGKFIAAIEVYDGIDQATKAMAVGEAMDINCQLILVEKGPPEDNKTDGRQQSPWSVVGAEEAVVSEAINCNGQLAVVGATDNDQMEEAAAEFGALAVAALVPTAKGREVNLIGKLLEGATKDAEAIDCNKKRI